MSSAIPTDRVPAGTRVLRALVWLLVLAYFAAGSAYLALRYLVWPNTGLWLPHVERMLSESIGKPLRIGEVHAGFDGLRPSLDVRGVAVLDAAGDPAFSVRRIHAALSLSSLSVGQLRFARLDLDAPSLRVERVDADRFLIGGIEVDLSGSGEGAGVDWLLAQRRISLRGVDLEWVDRVSGRALDFRGADLVLGSAGRRHRLSLKVAQAPGLGGGLDAMIEVHRPALSRATDWKRWNGELHVAVAQAELPELAKWARELRASGPFDPVLSPVEIVRGRAAASLWGRFEDGVPVDGVLKLSALGTGFALADGPLSVPELDLEAELSRGRGGRSLLRFRRLEARVEDGLTLRLLPDVMQVLRIDAASGVEGGEFALDRFDANKLLGLVRRLPWPPEIQARLAPVRADGMVERLAFGWDDAPPLRGSQEGSVGAGLRYTLDARFEGLSLAREAPDPAPGGLGLPSFRNLSGSVSLNEAGGRLVAAGRKAVLVFPGLFAEPAVPLEAIDARLSWRMTVARDGSPGPAEVDIEQLRFAAVDAAGEMSGRYTSGGKGLGKVDLGGSLSRADATRVARYLPLEIPAEVRGWVARAIRSGRSDDVRFVLRGDLLDFPYRDPGSGLFRVEAALRDTTLAYAPGWPAIEKIRGRLLFEGAGMDIEAQSARLWGVSLGRTRARIAEYRDGLLRIEGGGEGPAQDMLRFIDQSPLRNRVGDFSRGIRAIGSAKLGLELDIPLDDPEATRVAGTVRFDGNELVLDEAIPPFTRVAGTLAFTEDSLALRGMSGVFLGGALRVDGETSEAGRLALRANGRASADGIRRLVDNALTRALDGATDWRAAIDVRGRVPALVVESDLAGLSSRLPAPFAKQAGDAWPLRIETTPAPTGDGVDRRDTLGITMRDDVRLVFDRERDPASGTMKVRRGVFALTSEPLMPASGFAVRLQAPKVDIDAWAAVLGPALESESDSPGEAFSLLPSELSLISGELRLGGKTLDEVVVGATRSGGFWRANIHSRQVDGFFNWRAALPGQPIGTLTARFGRLEIPRARGDEVASLLDDAPQLLPALDIAAEEFVLAGRSLGRLTLRAVNSGSPVTPVWRVEALNVTHPAASLRARGDWRSPRREARRAMALDFELDVADAGRLLAVYGFEGTMRDAAGSLAGSIVWAGSPFSIDYPSLGGQLLLKLGKGEFLKTDPGIAKLIGVLNLQSLRRRLAFDFRDLFAEGFSFDEVAGSVKISKGIAQTDDFTMKGLTAQVKIVGSTDLSAETQDLLVEVRPELNAGLASLAYAALANPAIGLGTFLAQWLLREPLRDIFAWQYEVKGSWSDPTVNTRSRPVIEAPPPGH